MVHLIQPHAYSCMLFPTIKRLRKGAMTFACGELDAFQVNIHRPYIHYTGNALFTIYVRE